MQTKVGTANYAVVDVTRDELVIRDLGPWSAFKSVTQDAESVAKKLHKSGYLEYRDPETGETSQRRLLYYDSTGNLHEIVVEDGKFAGFRLMTTRMVKHGEVAAGQRNKG